MRRKWIRKGLPLVVVILFLTLARYIWLTHPTVLIHGIQYEHNEHIAPPIENDPQVKELVAIGDRAIPQVISAIRTSGGVWDKNTTCLPYLIREFGQLGHQRLLAAIDSETDPQAKISLVCTLQVAFDDYSRLPMWLDNIRDDAYSSQVLERLLWEKMNSFLKIPKVAMDFEKVPDDECYPPVLLDYSSTGPKRQFNPDFLAWYRRLSGPGRPLPAWHPKN